MECDACGASYAHPKCLAKHRWDRHMDRWSMVEGMLEMNKQQQVQVMEVSFNPRLICLLCGRSSYSLDIFHFITFRLLKF